jgi:hypothetical protein
MELAMGHRQRAAELLAKADRYRVHARSLSDRETAGRIWDLTEEMERQAQHLIKMLQEERIRTRAHQIWQQHNCPPGRDDEFWLQAERELEDAQQSQVFCLRAGTTELINDKVIRRENPMNTPGRAP